MLADLTFSFMHILLYSDVFMKSGTLNWNIIAPQFEFTLSSIKPMQRCCHIGCKCFHIQRINSNIFNVLNASTFSLSTFGILRVVQEILLYFSYVFRSMRTTLGFIFVENFIDVAVAVLDTYVIQSLKFHLRLPGTTHGS